MRSGEAFHLTPHEPTVVTDIQLAIWPYRRTIWSTTNVSHHNLAAIRVTPRDVARFDFHHNHAAI
jgi:hypothetical protein